MSNNKPISPQEQEELIASWETKLRALDDRLRSYGHTVTVTTASDGEELTASIPQCKKSSRMEGIERQINARFAMPSTVRNTTDLTPSPSRRRKPPSTLPQ